MDLGLSGHVVVLTGASSGIGRAVAERLAVEGAHVVGVARNRERLGAALDELGGGPHEAVGADVTDPDAAGTVVAAAERAFGRLDALVCGAGASARRTPEALTDAEWQDQWELNVMGPMRLMREATELLAAAPDGGRVVHVSSSSGKRASGMNVAYSVTKTAQLALSRAFAEHLAGHGVRVNAVTPGPIDSEIWLSDGGLGDQLAEEAGVDRETLLQRRRGAVPLGRFGRPEEIADAIVLLASPRAGYATGGAWSVDGGAASTIL